MTVMTPHQTTELALRRIVNEVLARYGESIAKEAAKVRTMHPTLSDREIADLLIRRYRRRAGCAGALSGAGGAITLPVTLPAGVLASWVIATQTVLAVANVYGYAPDDEQLLFDVLMVLAANGVISTLQEMTTISAQRMSRKAVEKYITREVMVRINRVVPRKALTKAGQKSLTSFTKLAPLIGAPIGYGFEHRFITGVGRRAIGWYEPPDGPEPSAQAAAA
jgi:hypothetical protein